MSVFAKVSMKMNFSIPREVFGDHLIVIRCIHLLVKVLVVNYLLSSFSQFALQFLSSISYWKPLAQIWVLIVYMDVVVDVTMSEGSDWGSKMFVLKFTYYTLYILYNM